MSKPSQKIFLEKDRALLKKNGILSTRATEQLTRFRKGFPFVELKDPCVVGKGIIKLSPAEQKKAEADFFREAPQKNILKFVPASGAASRMFHFLEDPGSEFADLKQKFLKYLPDFAFYSELERALKKKGQDLLTLRRAKKLAPILNALLEEKGLGYRQAPKGMILFHGHGKSARTAFAEQLSEAAIFESAEKKIRVHFTLPETARTLVRRHLKENALSVRGRKFILGDSIQSSATNCLATETTSAPARTQSGDLLLRPAGHGALLDNLNEIKSDVIYIKNIDNILPAQNRKEADKWKRILGGVFLETQKQVFLAQKILNQKKMRPAEALSVLRLAGKLGWQGTNRKSLTAFIHRPLRVCGMVPNAGEPGGGPFWIRDSSGNISPQIIESAEVDFRNKKQEKIWRSSTHFNPVEFICGVYDYHGRKYDLMDFVDENRGIISKKSHQGRQIRVMELPGLWNGGMANWITLFIEIPGTVFAPVKTVLDLLRKEHQIARSR